MCLARITLNNVFDEVIVVDLVDSRDYVHLSLLGRPELGITFTKIHCWTLTQYRKCVFLDADTLVSELLWIIDLGIVTVHQHLNGCHRAQCLWFRGGHFCSFCN